MAGSSGSYSSVLVLVVFVRFPGSSYGLSMTMTGLCLDGLDSPRLGVILVDKTFVVLVGSLITVGMESIGLRLEVVEEDSAGSHMLGIIIKSLFIVVVVGVLGDSTRGLASSDECSLTRPGMYKLLAIEVLPSSVWFQLPQSCCFVVS